MFIIGRSGSVLLTRSVPRFLCKLKALIDGHIKLAGHEWSGIRPYQRSGGLWVEGNRGGFSLTLLGLKEGGTGRWGYRQAGTRGKYVRSRRCSWRMKIEDEDDDEDELGDRRTTWDACLEPDEERGGPAPAR